MTNKKKIALYIFLKLMFYCFPVSSENTLRFVLLIIQLVKGDIRVR